ncbi:MgtC/SapB family protein [Clostridium cylindrosporum]|uniref:MgtC/SapB transporter n=1 Tax=Clostridium cylindrosporum DSM 605 TaxID=1121307 RepID=A0A0J8D9V6_CLOCY|nr:MgtC/SapB family protein [Clostridium cylindrosporum]KMT22622.1 MgtC/SapB transporter [Clostridium cylindrosporum DSM 605]
MDYIIIGESLLKLLLALILGGLIGGEREHKSRPAGLRTHMLVCIGATLIEITSINYYHEFRGGFNVDPMRLGAQVISGIGFLGAGTIIKEGASIRGLTTAASIWVVGCLGLTIGAGLYIEAILGTVFMYIALKCFKSLEGRIARGRRIYCLEIVAENIPGKIGEIGTQMGNCGVSILNVDMRDADSSHFTMELVVKSTGNINHSLIVEKVASLQGVKEVKFI